MTFGDITRDGCGVMANGADEGVSAKPISQGCAPIHARGILGEHPALSQPLSSPCTPRTHRSPAGCTQARCPRRRWRPRSGSCRHQKGGHGGSPGASHPWTGSGPGWSRAARSPCTRRCLQGRRGMRYKEHGDAHRGHPQGSSREGTGSPGAGTPVARHSRDAVLFSRTARSTSLGSMFGGTATQACVAISSAQPKTQTGCTAHTSPRSGREPQHCTVPPLPSKSVTRFFFSAPFLVSHPAPSASRPARPPLRGWLRHRCRHLHRSGQPSRSRGRREGSRLALVTCNPTSSAPAAPGHTALPCTPPQPHHAPQPGRCCPWLAAGPRPSSS